MTCARPMPNEAAAAGVAVTTRFWIVRAWSIGKRRIRPVAKVNRHRQRSRGGGGHCWGFHYAFDQRRYYAICHARAVADNPVLNGGPQQRRGDGSAPMRLVVRREFQNMEHEQRRGRGAGDGRVAKAPAGSLRH